MSKRDTSDMALIADVPIDDDDVALMVEYGFAVVPVDGVLTLTEKGGAWVREWCKEQAASRSDATQSEEFSVAEDVRHG